MQMTIELGRYIAPAVTEHGAVRGVTFGSTGTHSIETSVLKASDTASSVENLNSSGDTSRETESSGSTSN
jgi:hypothetical protein